MNIYEMHNSANSMLNVLADQIVDGEYGDDLFEKEANDYLDPRLRKFSRRVAEGIVSMDERMTWDVLVQRTIRRPKGNETSEFLYKFKEFHNTGLDWIDCLNVLIDYDNRPKNELTTDDEDYMVLTNSAVYEYDPVLNVMRELNMEIRVTERQHLDIPVFLFDGEKIRTATILLRYCPNFGFSVQHYAYAISHELSHIWNLLEQKCDSQNKLNRNTSYTSAVPFEDIHTDNPRVEAITKVVAENMYFLNYSEMEARVFNFLDEISEHTPEETQLFHYKTDEEWCKILSNFSNTFEDYYKLYVIFDEYCIRDTDIETKREFAEKLLRDVWSKSDENGEYPFEQNFSVNGKYDEKSFDLFFSVLKEKIWKLFLKQCITIFCNLKPLTERMLRRKSGIIFEGLNSQNSVNHMKRYMTNLELYSKYTLKHIGCIEEYFR